MSWRIIDYHYLISDSKNKLIGKVLALWGRKPAASGRMDGEIREDRGHMNVCGFT
jgi:hypothetical protein